VRNERSANRDWRLAEVGRVHLDRLLSIELSCFTAPWTRGQFERQLAQPQILARGAFCPRRGSLEGYLIAWPVMGEVHLMNLAVHPARRRRGIGGALLDELLRRAEGEGWSPIWLEVRPSNEPALALYASRGFRIVGRRPEYYVDTGEDALLLRWG
jgi:ribosomal-protein-alanine N-acetyltransferase